MTAGEEMNVQVVEESPDELEAYGEVPIAFQVRSRLRVELSDGGLGGMSFTEEPVSPPYVKDYDADKGEGPLRWRKRWDVSRWGILAAFDGDRRVGGAVIAFDTKGADFLEGRKDLAALWDIRVLPEMRGKGIGHALFLQAAGWTRDRRCKALKIETQNINVPACRFYARQGCELGAINRYAYEAYPDEVQVVWYYRLR